MGQKENQILNILVVLMGNIWWKSCWWRILGEQILVQKSMVENLGGNAIFDIRNGSEGGL